ncbi:MAG TPA: hypothetical protein VJX67_05440 [Blastocatellia bacterium]|nr:hypothetical protein [Blastocatellia bacterium]
MDEANFLFLAAVPPCSSEDGQKMQGNMRIPVLLIKQSEERFCCRIVLARLAHMLAEAAAQPRENMVMAAFTRRRSLPAAPSAEPQETGIEEMGHADLVTLRTLPAVPSAEQRSRRAPDKAAEHH